MSASLHLPDPSGIEIDDIPAAIARISAQQAELSAEHNSTISQLSACQAQLASRLITDRKNHTGDEDRMLRATEACTILGVKRTWLYTHANSLPFVKNLTGDKRGRRYSQKGIYAWLAKKR